MDVQEVISAYNEIHSIHKVADMFHVSHTRISQLLKENNIQIQNVGKKKDVNASMIETMRQEYLNNHLTTMEIASKYSIPIKRLRKIFKENNIKISKWNGHIKKEKTIKPKHIKVINDIPLKGCLLCDWKTRDVSARTNAYYRHFLKKHSEIDLSSYVCEHPDEAPFFKSVIKNNQKIRCEICGKYLSAIDGRHLVKHNISKQDYLFRFPNSETLSNEYRHTLHANYEKMISNPDWERFSSSYERELQAFLTENNIIFETHNRSILGNGQELDIFIPEKKIAIEFNGCLQHTEWFGGKARQYHLTKTKLCGACEIRLIHIFEDEYVYHKDIVYNKLSHLLNIDTAKPRIGGRQCKITEIKEAIANDFLNKYHIQGFATATLYLGAFFNEKLIAVMTFKRENKKNNNWELTRFATDYNYVCSGVGGKLFKYFIRNHEANEVKSFADRRWTINTDNNLYTKLGFEFIGFTPPEYRYYYIKDNKPERFHKFGFRKQALNKKYNLPMAMTETEMVKELGYDRIWDCGLIKYVWKREE